jgi:hypothetical protein
MKPHMKPLRDLLGIIGDDARRNNRPLPIIETDMETARLLRDLLMREATPDVAISRDNPEYVFGVVAMYDGVKIKGRK